MHPPVYLDHAATTPVRPEVLEAMMPYLTDQSFGNPSSAHRFGRAARAGMEQARRADRRGGRGGAQPGLLHLGRNRIGQSRHRGRGAGCARAGRRMCAAVSAIEHKAVLAAAHAVCHLGGREVLLPVDSGGRLDLDALDRALGEGPAVVSVMWVNNEVGVIQPVAGDREPLPRSGHHLPYRRGAGVRKGAGRRSASSPAPCLPFRATRSARPKGIGALIVRDRKAIEAIIHGGGQQSGIRPGTENVAGAVALGRAAQLAAAEQASVAARVGALRDDLATRLKATVPDVVINAESSARAPHLLSVAVPGADSESLLMHLDLAGIAVSSGSACSTGAVEPSHVLVAMGVSRELALGAIRFSFGRESTPDRRRPRRRRWCPRWRRRYGSSRGYSEGRSGDEHRVLVAMSGGVDCSVAAALLVEQGYDVVGATMKLFCYGDEVPDRPCCSLDSINDARDVAHALGDPALRAQSGGPVQPARRSTISSSEYAAGRTPIPCVRCNSFTKFRDLLAQADALDCDYIATGHYAWPATAACTGDGTAPRTRPTSSGGSIEGGGPDADAGRRDVQGRDPGLCPAAGAHHRGEEGVCRDLLRAQ